MAKPDVEEQLRFDSATVWDTAPGIPPWAEQFYRHVYLRIDVTRFAGMYREGGRKPISPRLLGAITILQYVHHVSDREAVTNTLVRRDWRVALGLTPDYDGFNATVLVRFRRRLVAAGLEKELFDTVLEEARRLGILKDRRRLRIDATKLLADVSDLSRGDLLRETLRVVVCDLADAAPELEGDAGFDRLLERYGEESWLGRHHGESGLVPLAQDGYALLALCEGRSVGRAALLARVLSENFVVEEGTPRARTSDEMSSDRVRSPHDPDAKLGRKRNDKWIGDQVHVVETADGDLNLVVGVLVTDPRQEDSTVLGEVRDLGLSQVPEAERLLADTGYASVANTLASEEAGIALVSPPRPDTHKKGLRPSEFEIDFAAKTACCPAGHAPQNWGERRDGSLLISWADACCAACPLRGDCTTSKEGRKLNLSPHWERLQQERRLAQTDEFRQEYRHRAGVETTISELVRRHGLRRSRYRGAPKRRLHAILAVTALNAKRLLRWVLLPSEEAEAAVARRLAACAGSA